LMKNYQVCLPEDKIKDEYLKSIDSKKYVSAWKQAKDTIVSLNIYNRILNKLENINIDNLTAKNRKDNEIKHRTFTNLKSMYTDILSNLDPLIDEDLKMTFSDTPYDEVLDNTNVEVKSALLVKYHGLSVEQQNNFTFNELIKATVKEKTSQNKQVMQQMNELGHDYQHKDAYNEIGRAHV